MDDYLLETKDLKRYFPIKSGPLRRTMGQVKAVDGVNIQLRHGETLGVVGESGCGKSTLARLILRLQEPTAGKVVFEGENILNSDRKRMLELRREMQIVFQDPQASLNPRMTVGNIIAQPLKIHSRTVRISARVYELLEMVGLNPDHYKRYPHELSGGQRQRVGIARAIALKPKLIVCDEPVSSLDVSVQAQIVNLLKDLQRELGLAYVFISHELSMIKYVSDKVAVMYLGKIVELLDRHTTDDAARHPYTRSLLAAVPVPDPELERKRRRIILQGNVPSASEPPPGCTFHTRCPRVQSYCKEHVPEPVEASPTGGALVSCFFPVGKGEPVEQPEGRFSSV